MKLVLEIKLILYRLFSAYLGRKTLDFLSFGVNATNLGNGKNPKNKPFLIAITVDTESGYVLNNEKRVWQGEKPEAFEGFYYGIKNLLSVFRKHNAKGTFFLSTQCFSAQGKERALISRQLKALIKNKHELGLHLHADSDFAL